MNYVALVVNQNVLVVSIFYLKNIAHERVGCKTLIECVLGFLEVLRSCVSASEPVYEEF